MDTELEMDVLKTGVVDLDAWTSKDTPEEESPTDNHPNGDEQFMNRLDWRIPINEYVFHMTVPPPL